MNEENKKKRHKKDVRFVEEKIIPTLNKLLNPEGTVETIEIPSNYKEFLCQTSTLATLESQYEHIKEWVKVNRRNISDEEIKMQSTQLFITMKLLGRGFWSVNTQKGKKDEIYSDAYEHMREDIIAVREAIQQGTSIEVLKGTGKRQSLSNRPKTGQNARAPKGTAKRAQRNQYPIGEDSDKQDKNERKGNSDSNRATKNNSGDSSKQSKTARNVGIGNPKQSISGVLAEKQQREDIGKLQQKIQDEQATAEKLASIQALQQEMLEALEKLEELLEQRNQLADKILELNGQIQELRASIQAKESEYQGKMEKLMDDL